MVHRSFVLLALACLLAACGGDDGPRFAGEELPQRAFEGAPGHFHPSAIRAYWYFNEPYGQRRMVHFVANGPRRTHVRQARECVEHHLEEEDVEAPFCFAYPTQRAYEHIRFDPANGDYQGNCWSARAQKPADSELTASPAGDPDATMGEEGCPDIAR